MKHKLLLLCVTATLHLHATSIITLLNSLEHRPESTLDALNVQKSALAGTSVNDKLLPTINLFGSYEHFSDPTGMLPVAPNDLIKMVQNPVVPQPFSQNILRGGASFTWPVFIKSLYTLQDRAELMHLAAKEKKRLNLLQRQALVVGSVAQLRYLEALKHALEVKKRSIHETAVTTKMKVRNGRAPQSAMIILDSNINELDIAMNTVDLQSNTLRSKIETLTGIHLKTSVSLHEKHNVHKEEIFALRPLQKNVEAGQKAVQAAHEAYYPSLVTKGSYSYSQGDAYNNDMRVNENYGSAGLYVSMPLFDHAKGTAVEQAKVALLKEKIQTEQSRHALLVQTSELEREIHLIKRSVTLAQRSVKNQQKLLKIAKVSLHNASITEEEYLRYEDALANAKAKLYSFKAKQWQDLAQLAVIYGNDLKEIVK